MASGPQGAKGGEALFSFAVALLGSYFAVSALMLNRDTGLFGGLIGLVLAVLSTVNGVQNLRRRPVAVDPADAVQTDRIGPGLAWTILYFVLALAVGLQWATGIWTAIFLHRSRVSLWFLIGLPLVLVALIEIVLLRGMGVPLFPGLLLGGVLPRLL